MFLIAAIGQGNSVIGRSAGKPWQIAEETARLDELTRGQTIIIGRRSWDIFGDSLVSAHNIVLTRQGSELADAIAVPNLDVAVDCAATYDKQTFVLGGATVFRQALPRVSAMYLTQVKGDYEGDVFFPPYDVSRWSLEELQERPGYDFVTYRRKVLA